MRASRKASSLVAAVAAAGLLVSGCMSRPSGSPSQEPLAEAEADYAASAFDQAVEALGRVRGPEARGFRASLLRGQLALLKNRFREAERELRRAGELDASAKPPKLLLAEALVRQDRYGDAAPLYTTAGRADRAAQAAAVGAGHAYQIEGPVEVRIKADRVDPLMVVSASVNGAAPAFFLLDTGGAQVILDPAFAASVGVKALGQETGEFSGGKKAAFSLARADSLAMEGAGGTFTLRDIPVDLLDTRRFSAAFRGLRIDGVIGTQLLYHFRATLDYPAGELVLRRPDSPDPKHQSVTPMWMGGDHYMVAMGSLNGVGPLPFFPDVGLAGLAFTGPDATLQQAGVPLTAPEVTSGGGGGGAHAARPIHIDRLSFGSVERRDLAGVAGAFPPNLERSQGYRIAGIISHAFFRPYAVTFDFRRMQIDLDCPAEKLPSVLLNRR